MPGGGDKGGAGEDAAGIVDDILLQEIVVGIAVHEGRDVHDHKAFLEIGDEDESVKHVDRLLLVLGQADARGIERERARHRNRSGERSRHIGALAEGRDGRGHDAFRETFLVDVRDVENFEAARAVRGVEIFAAQDEILNVLPAVFVGFGQLGVGGEVLLIICRVSDAMQMAADHSLRLLLFCPDDSVKAFAPFAHIRVTAEEIHRPGAEAEELRHPGVVVVRLREMAIGAILRRAHTARGVREMRIESLPAVAFGRNRLRLRVNPLAILIL